MISTRILPYFVCAVLLVMLQDSSTHVKENALAARIAELELQLATSHPRSPEALELSTALQRLKRQELRYSKPEEPDGFALFNRMIRTPLDLDAPAYVRGHKFRELKTAIEKRKTLGLKSDPLPWIERGPGNVSGRSRGVIFDRRDTSGASWWFGTVGGGIWRTEDAGVNWIEMTPRLPLLSTSTIVQSSSHPEIFYAGTGEGFGNFDAVKGDGIFKSTDGGQTWIALSSTVANSSFDHVNRIIVDPDNPDILVVATNFAIMRSEDGGETWSMRFSGSGRVQDLVANPGDFRMQYASANGNNESKVLKSLNGGITWKTLTLPFGADPGRIELAISASDTAWIYAAAQDTMSSLFLSKDSGQQWSRIIERGGVSEEPDWMGPQGWYNNAILVNPQERTDVFVGGIDIWRMLIRDNNERSTNQMTVWTPRDNFRYTHADQHAFATFKPPGADKTIILNANDGGGSVSYDGGLTWSQIVGFNSTQFYGVDKKPGESVYVGGMQDNGTWISQSDPDHKSDWLPVLGGDGFESVWHFSDPNKVIGGIQRNLIYRSLDGGITWTEATTGLSDMGRDGTTDLGPFFTRLATSHAEPDLLFAVGKSGVWKSTDFGASWEARNLPTTGWSYRSLTSQVIVSPANPDVVWAGSALGGTSRLFVSTDRGENFLPSNDFGGSILGSISGLAAHPHLDSTAFALFSFSDRPHILRTDDLGQSWRDISSDFPDVATFCLLVLPHEPSTLWAGTEIGLFESTDEGESWHLADNGLPAAAIYELAVEEDQIIAATHGRGVWSVTIPELLGGQFLPPFLLSSNQPINHPVSLELWLRSAFDSTHVHVDGNRIATLASNTAGAKVSVDYLPNRNGAVSVTLTGFQNGTGRQSVREISAFQLRDVTSDYETSFAGASADFFSTVNKEGSFSIRSLDNPGFENLAIHSPHPYPNSAEMDFVLGIPIVLADLDAFIRFQEIAVVQPGITGFDFGTPEFRDYVVVEGSKDGRSWIPFISGYDARENPEWLSEFQSPSGSPSSEWIQTRTIDPLETFSRGDTLLIRFRLSSDANATGWGWYIDNLSISGGSIVGNEDASLPNAFTLQQNYPNPFNQTTRIAFDLPAEARVRLDIFDIQGRRVETIIDEIRRSGVHEVAFDASHLASGMYIFRLQGGSTVASRKMTIVR